MFGFLKKVAQKYSVVVADFKTVEKKFLDQGENKTEVKKYLDLFKKLRDKNKISGDQKNIDLWGKKPFKDFKKRLNDLDKEKTNTEKRKGAVNTTEEIPGAKKIKEDKNWVIYEILTNESAAELGQGTKWCIKHKRSYHWEVHSSHYNIYYIISKTLPAKDPWSKIAFLIDKEGDISYWDALNDDHFQVPKELKIPKFKYEKPSVWKYTGGAFDVSALGLTSLVGAPKEVDTNFYCCENQLKSLEGAPKKVGGDFSCYNNQLKSLEGAPKEVSGDFYCYDNQLTSLEGAPEKVGREFNCSVNKLKSLKGAPKEVGRDFSCSTNQLKSLEGAPQIVRGNFSCHNNQLISLDGAPEKVGGDFRCSSNNLTSLEGAPKKVGGDFYCEDQKSGKKFTEKEVRAVCNVKGKVYV